ncbi:GNAT family N-acetyltransferase [Sporobolomyces salmoneus]|uniref:GNAT family N-acetyltransferase n=1 Tax=Sporobolomyces salmoneus TaxID=183962 RepID=UPI00317A7A4C
MSSITLHSFKPSDFRALAEIYRPAFFQTRLTNYILSGVSPSACDEWFIKRLEKVYKEKYEDGNNGIEVIVAKRGEECVGFAWWDFFPSIEERHAGVEERFWPEGSPVREDVVEYMRRIEGADDLCRDAHWHLNILGVQLELQGQGIGRKMVHWGIDRAKQENVDCFLVSTEIGRPLYQRMGFIDIGEPLTATTRPEVTTWPMILRLRQ